MGIDKRWLLGGGVLYAGAAGAGYWYTRRTKFPSAGGAASAPTDDERMGTFDKIADRYDSDIDLDERTGGILKWRRRLLVDGGKARGRVLEVGAGTGRNIEHYMASPACTEVVLTDRSAEMLEEAIKKYNELSQKAGTSAGLEKRPKFYFRVVDAADLGATFPPQSFDTVVDTFGLCSYPDPVGVLEQMQQLCKRDGHGRILLLEHGRSRSWSWLSRYLDKRSNRHARRWGCWWNRDIEYLIAKAGLHVLQKKTYHLGTGYFIVAEPSSSHRAEEVAGASRTTTFAPSSSPPQQ